MVTDQRSRHYIQGYLHLATGHPYLCIGAFIYGRFQKFPRTSCSTITPTERKFGRLKFIFLQVRMICVVRLVLTHDWFLVFLVELNSKLLLVRSRFPEPVAAHRRLWIVSLDQLVAQKRAYLTPKHHRQRLGLVVGLLFNASPLKSWGKYPCSGRPPWLVDIFTCIFVSETVRILHRYKKTQVLHP